MLQLTLKLIVIDYKYIPFLKLRVGLVFQY